MQFYNVHSHIFNARNAPQRFLELFLPKILARFVDKATNTKVGAAGFQWLLPLFGSLGKRYASFLQIGKSASQLDIFETLMRQYDDPTIKFVALTMYMEKCGAGNSESGFEGQLEEILAVKKRYPDNLLIFMGIDPRWKFSGAELQQTVQRYFETKLEINASRSVYPFAGLKLYPSLGFYGFDERLQETLTWAAQNQVPVLSHCNYLGGIYTNDTSYIQGNLNPMDPYTNQRYSANFPSSAPPAYQTRGSFGKWLLGRNENESNMYSCSYFLEPASFRSLLQHFKDAGTPLKLCLAHFGGAEHILLQAANQAPKDALISMDPSNWCAQIKALIADFEGVYTDISYAVSNPKIHDPIFKDLQTSPLGERIMFGTDFFLTERELPEKSDYATFKAKALNVPMGSSNAWEVMAARNTEQFLRSKYYKVGTNTGSNSFRVTKKAIIWKKP